VKWLVFIANWRNLKAIRDYNEFSESWWSKFMKSERKPNSFGNYNKEGFTLVELLVVISIIAILLAVLMPSLQKARGLARRIVCAGHQRSMFFTLTAYAQTYEAFFPATGGGARWLNFNTGATLNPVTDTSAYWAIAYVKYGATREMFRCAAKKVNGEPTIKMDTEIKRKSLDYSDYGLNGFICWKTRKNSSGVDVIDMSEGKIRKLTEFKRPTETIILHDHYEALMDFKPADKGDAYYIPSYLTSDRRNLLQWRYMEEIFDPVRSKGCVNECWRHNHFSNILWLDGHVKTLKETLGEDVPYSWYHGGTVDER
jgi:prepilin-type N-terminal cleavage/methylation domain-containing protein/prepilin-type processing-associated H-X9-DG protein